MNQTVTINIGGIVFHIEVDAYETLKNYLNKIKGYFDNSEERDEIMNDIEARIAEIFSGMKNEKNQVITSSDVDTLIGVMGKPEQYINEESEANENSSKSKTYQYTFSTKSEKKLFRDKDEQVIGGVCSGLGAYIGVDTVWVRLFFVIAFFIGFGLITYIIFWIVMPEAKTASDKLKMKGEPINVQNIGRKIEEEANNLNEKIKNMNTSKVSGKASSVIQNTFSAIGSVFTTIFSLVGKFIGITFLVIGVFLLVILLGMLFGSRTILSITNEGIFSFESADFFNMIFESQDQYLLAMLGFALVIGIPILTLIHLAVKLLFNYKLHKGLGIAASILFTIGIAICVLIGIRVGTEISADDEIVKTQIVNSTNTTLYIKSPNASMPGKGILDEKVTSISLTGDSLYMNEVELGIEPSKNDSILLEIKYKSNGSTPKNALNNVRMIHYNYLITDSTFILDNYFSTPKENKIRGQEVELTLYIPINKTIYLDDSVRDLIYDIDNVTNTYDKEMIRNKWIMLKSGLTCLDCYDIKGISSKQLDSLNTYIPIN